LDLSEWRNQGVVLNFADVPWSTNRAAWAPSVACKNGRYFMYFSAGDGAGIGVAASEGPTGPFVDTLGKPLIAEYHHGAQPIDAHAFVDDDDLAYLFYGGWREAVVVELGEDMVSTKGDFHRITADGYVEGPFMVKRRGEYYLLWSEGSWGDATYAVAYARSDSPLGPFVRRGKVLESDHDIGTSAGHCSVLQVPGSEDDWLIAYHRRPLDQVHRDCRVVCIDRLFFDAQGDISPVRLT
jgi:beta-xylosidase